VRIRESRTPDGGRVLLTSDVTEERQRAAELRLLAMAVEQGSEPVEITDAGHCFTYVNHAFETTTGWTRQEALGRVPQDILSSGHHAPAYFEELRKVLESGRTWHGTIVNRHRDGHLIEQETTITPLRADGGAITHFVAVKRDVTEARAQARALAESEARYRAVVDAQTELIIRVDAEGRWTFMNEAAQRNFGLTVEEFVARGYRDPDFIYEPDRPIYAAHIARLTPENPTDTVEWRACRIDGTLVDWEQWTDTGIFDAQGKLVEMQCVGRLITDRKEAELAREEAERLRRAALEGALDCYISVDEAGRVLEFNPAAERTFGYARDQVLGQPLAELIVPPHLREAHERGMARHRAGGESRVLGKRVEMDAMRSDGSVFPVELVIVKSDRAEGAVFIAYLRDLTDRRAAERALAEREAQFRAITENAPVAITISEFESAKPLYFNPLARRNLCIAEGGEPSSMNDTWEDPGQRATVLDAVRAGGAIEGIEAGYVRCDGSRGTSLVSATRITYGGREALLAASIDISALREAERALRESQARLAAFIEFAPVAVHLRDREGHYLMLNRGMEQIIGKPASEILGRFPSDLAPPEVVGNSDLHHREVVETGQLRVSEQHLEHLEGAYNWVMAIRFPVFGADGAVSAVGTFAVDITERKEAEAQLKASEARLAAIIDANPIAMNIARLSDRKLLFVNQPYMEMFGLEQPELDSFDRRRLYADPGQGDTIYDEVRAGRGVTNLEIILRRKDGVEVPASLTSRPILFQGEPAVVTSSMDLTALRAARAEAARSREALHQSEKMTALGALLAGVAHELNNPLSVVVGYSSMLKEIVEDADTRTRVERIHAAAERCARIVRTFLAMARSRPPKRGPVAMSQVVMDALDLAAYGLRSADVEIEVDVPADLPPVWGDADQLHQVLVNLVVNAQHALLARATPRRLAIRATAAGATVTLTVTDNGPGMSEAVVKRAFEPFFTTKAQGVGTGVGLSVVHGIVTAHGGSITVDTVEGEGATFRVELPTTSAEVVAESAAPAPAAGCGRVLVVDDEPDIAALLAERLRADGLAVETAASGRRALAVLDATAVDLVVSDLRMPDMDGVALVEAIAARRPDLRDRVVLITGDALGAGLGGTLEDRGLPIFEKPLDLAALSAEIRRRIGTERPA
jgi:PAS domain S-box-containing protein